MRRFPRVPLGHSIAFSTKDEGVPVHVEGTARDISLGGMFIETDVPAQLDERIVVHLTLRRGERKLALPAVVRWTARDGMGVQFGLLGARDTHDIIGFVGKGR